MRYVLIRMVGLRAAEETCGSLQCVSPEKHEFFAHLLGCIGAKSEIRRCGRCGVA